MRQKKVIELIKMGKENLQKYLNFKMPFTDIHNKLQSNFASKNKTHYTQLEDKNIFFGYSNIN